MLIVLISDDIILHKYTIHIFLYFSTRFSTFIHYHGFLFNLLFYFPLLIATLFFYIKFSTPVYNLQI